MATVEIERKFLVKKLPSKVAYARESLIEQGYLAVATDGSEVRIRKKSARHFLTAKSGGDLARTEAEIEIDGNQFKKLWPLTQGRRLEKSRFELDMGGVLIEVDVYKGALAGLIVAEVEFTSLDASAHFVAPDWFGLEVTADARYKNRSLASAASVAPLLPTSS